MTNKTLVLVKDVISDLRANFPQMIEGVDCIYDRNFFQDIKIPTKNGDVYVLLFPAEKEKPSYLRGLLNALKPEYYNPVHNFEVEKVEIHGMFPEKKKVEIPGCTSREYRGFPHLPDKGWDKGGFATERKLEPGTFNTDSIVAETKRIANAV